MTKPWDLPERQVTPESFLSRRRWLKRLVGGGLAIGGPVLASAGLWWAHQDSGSAEEVLGPTLDDLPGRDLYPALPHPDFRSADAPVSDELAVARHCNFYEFARGKDVWRHIAAFRPSPWTVEVAGLVARPRTYDLDDLLHTFPLEERIYRHRCVEAWAMVVPWTGFPLAALLKKAEPLPGARYVRFVSFQRPEEAVRQKDSSLPWPYTEGLTLAEATNELTFLATGMYGHPLRKQHGAPLRLVVPWKYGFKSAKSIVRIELIERRPSTFWNTLVPHEYDFWANVNPSLPHPRWSQASERSLGSEERLPTQLYNGYGKWVAGLYPS